MSLNCLDCKSKSCKLKGTDCFGLHDKSIEKYREEGGLETVKSSSALIDNGRAGLLSRFQEVIEFCKLQGYGKIGLAYCYGMETLAEDVRRKMTGQGLNLIPARCTMGGVKEAEIDSDKNNEVISCNPAGQALFLNDRTDFVIEMGLCLGHDVLFHKALEVPFTVLVVKDRVYNHNPLQAIKNY